MQYCILASGSKGNSIFVESYYGRVLIDVGLTARQIELRLQSRDVEPDSIDAVVLTHAHRDHVRGVGVFANRYKIPIYAHPDTLDSITPLLKRNQVVHPWQGPFEIVGLRFTPFRLPHDCDPTVGYLIEENGRVLGLCTDLGVVTEEVRRHVRQAQALILESNHDSHLLMTGPYPWHLKERIAGRGGHLSNDEAGELLREILHPGIGQVVLGHLSDENNTPELALTTALRYVGQAGEALIEVIEQRTVSRMFSL